MEPKICTMSTIKAPLIETLAWVNYHLNIGVDHMFICFDNPKDSAIKILKNNKRITCIQCDNTYWKKLGINPKAPFQERLELNAKFVFNQLRQKNYEWMFAHLDSDELIYIKKGLKELLKKTPKKVDVLCLLPLESVPEKESYKKRFEEITLFRDISWISRIYYPHKSLLQKIVPLLKKEEGNIAGVYFRGHAAGKSIVRVGAPIDRFQGHRPLPKRGKKLKFKFPRQGNILHFEGLGFEEWKNKWEGKHKRKNPTISMNKSRIKFYKKFVKIYKKGDEKKLKKLYKEQSMVSEPLKSILLAIGFLRRIKLNKKLFESRA